MPDTLRTALPTSPVPVQGFFGVPSRYLEAFLISKTGGQAHFRKFTYGQGRPHLGFEDLQSAAIPMPPAGEQDTLLSEIDRVMTNLSKADITVRRELAQCDTLRQSLLKHAFSGKLVPQDPSDEPASVLLERIRTQRRELDAAPRKAGRRKSQKSS